MIESLHGILLSKEPVFAVIDVHGVGFGVHITLSTYESLPEKGGEVTLLTHMHVREDALQLFGFQHATERRMFRKLQSISGIGARMALNILSGVAPDELRHRVTSGDIAALTRIPGIGRKTAERIVVELRDSFAREGGGEEAAGGGGITGARDEALLALQALGYPRNTAEKAIAAVQRTGENAGISPSDLIKKALQQLNVR